MDTSKLVTVAVWATVAVVLFEAFRQAGGISSSIGSLSNPQADAISQANFLGANYQLTGTESPDQFTTDLLANNVTNASPQFFLSGDEAGILGEYGI